MDGVLFDSERISRMVWIQAGAEYHLADVEEAERCVIGRSFADTCQFLKERYGPTFPAVEFRTTIAYSASSILYSSIKSYCLPVNS